MRECGHHFAHSVVQRLGSLGRSSEYKLYKYSCIILYIYRVSIKYGICIYYLPNQKRWKNSACSNLFVSLKVRIFFNYISEIKIFLQKERKGVADLSTLKQQPLFSGSWKPLILKVSINEDDRCFFCRPVRIINPVYNGGLSNLTIYLALACCRLCRVDEETPKLYHRFSFNQTFKTSYSITVFEYTIRNFELPPTTIRCEQSLL